MQKAFTYFFFIICCTIAEGLFAHPNAKSLNSEWSLVDKDSNYLDKDSLDIVPKFILHSGNLVPHSIYYKEFQQWKKRGTLVSYVEVLGFFEKLIKKAENNGFPFASVKMSILQSEREVISASVDFESGPYITYDSVSIVGNSKTKIQFLCKYMGLNFGEPFSQKQINEGITRLKNLNYLKMEGDADISFQNQSAKLFLPLFERRINKFDAILGVLPSSGNSGKYFLTGWIDFSLYNISGRGRNLAVNWQRPGIGSQTLSLEALEPHVLGSKVNLHGDFSLLKQDSLFFNKALEMKLGYPLKSTYLMVFTSDKRSVVLTSIGLKSANGEIQMIDNRFQVVGFSVLKHQLDDLFHPKRGYKISSETGIGNKKIFQNSSLSEAEFKAYSKNSFQYYITGGIEQYSKLSSRMIMSTRLSFGNIDGTNIFKNELYRVGGIKTIRGFDENYFFAKNYLIFNIEPRFYFDTYSYFMIFADIARLGGQKTIAPFEKPFSSGLGLSLETEGGVFSFILAQGKSSHQQFKIQQSRVHFGYTGRF